MTDLRKAAEMALEALETLWDILDDIDTTSDIAKENDAWYRKRVEFLQKKRWDTSITTDGYKLKGGVIEALRQALAQPEQEPAGWLNANEGVDAYAFTWRKKETHDIPLYTAPPKREWVGLTDEEVRECKIDGGLPHSVNWRLSAKVMQAKLKEKNGW